MTRHASTALLLLAFASLHAQGDSSAAPIADSATASDSAAIGLDKVRVTGRKSPMPQESDQAARMPLKNLENPQAYSVVTSETLEKKGIHTYSDALRTVPGVVSEGAKPGVRSWPQLRGFSDQAFFRNGKMLGSWTENDVANIERIEVLKGPSGALFGGHGRASYGGIINRVTKSPYAGFGGEAELTAGDNGYNRMTLDINAPVNKDSTLLSRVNAAYRKEDSFQDYGWGESFFFAPVLTYQVNDRLSLRLESEFFKVEAASSDWYAGAGVTNLDQLLPFRKQSFLTDEITNKHQTAYFSADAVYKLDKHWTSTTSYAFSHSDYNYQSVMASVDLVRDSVDRLSGSYVYDINFTNIQQNFNGDFRVGPVRNRVVLGLDYLRDDELYAGVSAPLSSFAAGTIAPYVTAQDFQASLVGAPTWASGGLDERYSAYVSDVVSPLPVLHLMASLRYEYAVMSSPSPTVPNADDPAYTFNQGAWTPKFGAVYEILADRLSVFANYMGSTKNLNKLTVDDGAGNGTDVKAKPERATQYEGGFKADLFADRLTGTVSYFDITVDNMVRTSVVNPLFSVQDGTLNHRGLELDVTALPVPRLELTAGYAYLDATFENGANAGNQVAFAPKHSAKYWAAYTLPSGLGFGVGGDYRSTSFYDDANTITIPDANLVNASVSYTRPGYRLTFQVDNVSDGDYWGITGSPLPGRTFKGSAALKF